MHNGSLYNSRWSIVVLGQAPAQSPTLNECLHGRTPLLNLDKLRAIPLNLEGGISTVS